MTSPLPGRVCVVPFVAVVLSASAALAAPITITFHAVPDPLGVSTTNYYLTNPAGSTFVHGPTGLVAQGYYRPTGNANAWAGAGANLFIRNQTNDGGLGVCNAQELDCRVGVGGGGQQNELDNGDGYEELIRLTLPGGYRWVGFGLSSLDDNNDSNVAPERGLLWKSAGGVPGLTAGGNIGDGLPFQLGFDLTGPGVEPTFGIPVGFESAPYLFLEPFDWSGVGASIDNDYLLSSVTIEQIPEAPEPATLLLLGTGLVAFRAFRRRA
jgi:hypothetical protein